MEIAFALISLAILVKLSRKARAEREVAIEALNPFIMQEVQPQFPTTIEWAIFSTSDPMDALVSMARREAH